VRRSFFFLSPLWFLYDPRPGGRNQCRSILFVLSKIDLGWFTLRPFISSRSSKPVEERLSPCYDFPFCPWFFFHQCFHMAGLRDQGADRSKEVRTPPRFLPPLASFLMDRCFSILPESARLFTRHPTPRRRPGTIFAFSLSVPGQFLGPSPSAASGFLHTRIG